MKRTLQLLFFTLMSFFTILTINTGVFAEDDHGLKENGEKYEHNRSNEDEKENEYQHNATIPMVTGSWMIWSKEPLNNPNTPLPITVPAQLPVLANHNQTNLYFIPQDGQLLVSAGAIAKVLGGETTYFAQSRICVLRKNNAELIVRAGFNVAYENRAKTPMPVVAKSFENTVYLPISVAANALGYRVLWDDTKKMILLQTF